MGYVEDDPLSVESLTQTLGHLVVAEAMVIEAIRGRAVSERDAIAVRDALARAGRVARALDQAREISGEAGEDEPAADGETATPATTEGGRT